MERKSSTSPRLEPGENNGLSEDELQLRAQGHIGELPRQFTTISLLSFAYSVTNSWIGYSAVFVTPWFAGGPPAVVYCLIAAALACSIITIGLAELASAFPSSGGQYHFAFMVAPIRYRALIAFSTGWLSIFAWLFTIASACIYCAQICVNMATLFHPQYIPEQWHVYLVYVAFVAACTLITVFLSRQIPLLETISFFASITGVVVFFVVVLAVSPTKQPASAVFVRWDNQTGWGDGTAFFLAVGQAMYSYLAVDSASHIAEEVPEPGKRVPRTMWLTVVIGALTALPWTIAFLFSIQNLDAVSASPLPIMEIYRQALRGSNAGAAFLTTWLLIMYFGACIGCTVTTGRLIWAFARDGGMPYSKFFSQVNPAFETPANATMLAGVFCILYGLIYIGSTTAFNSFIATSILFLNITYALPQGVVLIRGRSLSLPVRSFDLGAFGTFANIFSVLWVALYTIFFCFPVFLPVTVGTMNYVCVIIIGVGVFIALLWWCRKRHDFTGPIIGEINALVPVPTTDATSTTNGSGTLAKHASPVK
ncbi:Choline transport protein [Cyphellophora attinorum]|uniref:Choline transport protein n=1 Tax=Cyphellophora attinorum TaxID=1664694 RepID=A0A0N1HFH5_9EURO|nr:Choline transport protein [Phialophora attinorum]KPI43975.1 Choline transport protein [Phialophora attinorum]